MRALLLTGLSLLSLLSAAEAPPRVVLVAAVAPDLVALRIQEREVPRQANVPYVAQAGDEIVPKDKPVVAWRDGKLVSEAKGFEVKQGKTVRGAISPDRQRFRPEDEGTGAWLDLAAARTATTYALTSADDPAYAKATTPTAVSLKRKPNGLRSRTAMSVVYLRLPSVLREGATYTLAIDGLEVDRRDLSFVHAPRTQRGEAVHVSHIGFHPQDPQKIGRISLWLGDGGAVDLGAAGPLSAEVIDEASGETVWSGTATRLRETTGSDAVVGKINLAKTAVYGVDFSALTRPGRYRLFVAGLGCSDPFPIADTAWAEAFRISMQGLLSHRSGIALPKDVMGYERPRNMHPADGVRVLPITRTMLDGESGAVLASFTDILAGGSIPEPLPRAWGGYMDAGDWDRRSQHLMVGLGLLEIYEVNPAYWRDLALVLPAEERGNGLPDLLDEARWVIDFYHRMQEADGGVRGGIESTSHPRPVEASWQESLALGAFAPDPISSLNFAAAAACYARLAADVDADHAKALGDAAVRAYAWAGTPSALAIVDRPDDQKGKKGKDLPAQTALARIRAAIHLLALTGEAEYRTAADVLFTGDRRPEQVEDLLFAYARLRPDLADAALQQRARADLLKLADGALAFQAGNAWGLATSAPSLPLMGYVGYLSVPGMISRCLPRAYILSGEAKYLAGTVTSCGFAAGGNPDNRAYTTGLGPNPVRWPLHIDSLMTGQEAPNGITVYGPCDPATDRDFDRWAHQWYVNDKQATPVGRQWPMAEAYFDIYTVPAYNEYTVHQTIGPTAYTWGFLACCPR